MARTTRTLNPIHFEDLEPHRFEDLVRQLAYQARQWRRLEALGRSGGDEGADIRGIELVLDSRESIGPDGMPLDSESDATSALEERAWIIQCKREKAIGPARARKIVTESFPTGSDVPYGYILAAACDFSRKTREALREELVALGIQEFEIWGKAELEDKLFQPINDHLLFAYFGLSLQIRRRSLKSDVRQRLAIKRAVAKAVSPDGMQRHLAWAVLIRDPTDDRYPVVSKVPGFIERPPWRYYRPEAYHPPDHIVFVVSEYFAYWNRKTGEWDAIMEHNGAILPHPALSGTSANRAARWELEERARSHSNAKVPAEMAARYMQFGLLHYDHILGVDLDGDSANEGPHLLVDYRGKDGPFDFTVFNLVSNDPTDGRPRSIRSDDSKRITIFAVPLPELEVKETELADDESPI